MDGWASHRIFALIWHLSFLCFPPGFGLRGCNVFLRLKTKYKKKLFDNLGNLLLKKKQTSFSNSVIKSRYKNLTIQKNIHSVNIHSV